VEGALSFYVKETIHGGKNSHFNPTRINKTALTVSYIWFIWLPLRRTLSSVGQFPPPKKKRAREREREKDAAWSRDGKCCKDEAALKDRVQCITWVKGTVTGIEGGGDKPRKGQIRNKGKRKANGLPLAETAGIWESAIITNHLGHICCYLTFNL